MNQPNYYDYLQWIEAQKMQMNQPMNQTNQPISQPILAYVQNRTAADLFNVTAGQSAILVDMDSPLIYRKERKTNNTLLPLQVFDLVPHVEKEPVVADMNGYVRREDLDKIISEEVEKRMAEVFSRPKKGDDR